MNNTRFVSSYSYSTLLDSQAPISGYDLYEDDNHRFAILTFYNNSSVQILSFKVKFVFFDKNHDFISDSVFKVVPQNFYSHRKYTLNDPLVMPRDADGFNFEILDVEKASAEQIRHEKLKYLVVKESSVFTKPKEEHFSKRFLLLGGIAFLAALSSICFGFISKASQNTGSNFDNGYGDNKGDNNGDNKNGIELGSDITQNGIRYRLESSNGWIIEGVDDDSVDYVGISSNPINGYPVYGIQSGAFKGNRNIRKVDINVSPDMKFIIQSGAFLDCTYLKDVSMTNVSLIEKEAFANCENLKSCYISFTDKMSGVVQDYAFDGCKSLEMVYVSGNLSFSKNAFPEWTEINKY